MKRFAMGIAAVLLLTGWAGQAAARDGSGFKAGARMWINDWVHDVPGAGRVTSDAAVLFGPAIEARFGEQLFLEASYLVSAADYRFYRAGYNSFDRQDADALLGFMVIPGFGVVAGYKQTTLEDTKGDIKDRLYGPVFGVLGKAWIDPYVEAYGRLNFLFTRFKQTTATGTFLEDSPGWVAEFGIRGSFTSQISATLGYKFETNTGNDTDVRDSFSGITLGMMIGF